MSTNDSRLLTLIYAMRDFFRIKNGKIVGVKVSQEDIQKSVAPDNFIVGQGVDKIIVSATPPVSPDVGTIWIDIS